MFLLYFTFHLYFNVIAIFVIEWEFHDSKLSLGVSIYLDRVSIETLNLDSFKMYVSTVKIILTASKSLSWRSRYLDRDWEILINFWSTFQSKKSQSQSRNLWRPENFVKSGQFFSILIEKVLKLTNSGSRLRQTVKNFEPELSQKASIMSRFLNKSR